jgi:hypothetical protein
MAYILVIYLIYILEIFLAFHLVAEVQRCPLSAEGRR